MRKSQVALALRLRSADLTSLCDARTRLRSVRHESVLLMRLGRADCAPNLWFSGRERKCGVCERQRQPHWLFCSFRSRLLFPSPPRDRACSERGVRPLQFSSTPACRSRPALENRGFVRGLFQLHSRDLYSRASELDFLWCFALPGCYCPSVLDILTLCCLPYKELLVGGIRAVFAIAMRVQTVLLAAT